MNIIFKINNGGQSVRELTERNEIIEIVKEENDWVEKSKTNGQDFFANTIWSTDLETLLEWCEKWAGKEVKYTVK